MLLTLTKFRNNLFSIANEVENNDETIFVGKKGKMDMVILSFDKYKRLEDKEKKIEKKNDNDGIKWLDFAGLGKKTKLAKMDNSDFEKEIEKIKYEHILNKHFN